MDYFELIRTRRSIRAYSRTPVEETMIQRILEAANAAPSAGNQQAYDIYVVRDAGQKMALAKAATSQDFVATAPVVLVFCASPARNEERYGERGAQLYSIQDAAVACTFAWLAAAAQGLGTVWIGAFKEDEVRRIIGAPRSARPLSMLPIGWPAEKPEAPGRRALDDLVHEAPMSTGADALRAP